MSTFLWSLASIAFGSVTGVAVTVLVCWLPELRRRRRSVAVGVRPVAWLRLEDVEWLEQHSVGMWHRDGRQLTAVERREVIGTYEAKVEAAHRRLAEMVGRTR